ncbi:hypothetical protein [Nonomuraea sp. NPDC003804]|uniref:hypothetical protein n=1 Tax=Nonomuraea sp. NPDC003804 TaxID=3154547 RepID=UPI0033A966CE
MGKAERNRRRRQQQGVRSQAWTDIPLGAVRGGTPAARAMAADVLDDVQMPCRVTFFDDPMFGGPKATVTSIQPDGSVSTDGKIINPPPVVLFEPTLTMMIQDRRTGTIHEARTEGIISNGFHRIPRGILANMPVEGWGLYRTATGLMLRDPLGGVWARGEVELEPAWLSEATSQGWVTVFFGPRLGVRVPPGRSASSYSVSDRISEFREGRSLGLCAAANVRWHPASPAETMDWALLPAGIFGQPLPLAYVPQFNFTRLGGPEAFGFVPAPDHIADVPIAIGLAADVTRTDVDLFQPHLDEGLDFVAGYRAIGGQMYDAWHAAAHTSGQILVITGHQDFPAGPEHRYDNLRDLMERLFQVVKDSYAAIVPLSKTPRYASPSEQNAHA